MAVIVDKHANSKIFEALANLNVTCFKSMSLDFLYKPVNTHPDMQIHFIDNYTAVCTPSVYNHYNNIFPDHINLIKGEADPGGTYPQDCAYNVVRLGKKIIGNLKYTDNKIKNLYSERGFEFINVNQGYTKCNLCVVDSNSVITEDDGLTKVLLSHGIDVLKIQVGQVELSGFKNGFIGGASGFISENCIAFCGAINQVDEYEKIKNFIEEKGLELVSLSDISLSDYGSLLFVNDFIK